MDWDMNQELFSQSEDQSEYTGYTDDQSNFNTEYTDDNSNFNYEFDDDDDDDDDQDEIVFSETKKTAKTSAALQKSIDDDFETSSTIPWDDESDVYNMNNNDGYDDFLSSTSSDWNAHGVVHIRLLRARNLPCPVGSSVGATVSLLPYKGKVKSKQTKAFLGPSLEHGVCVRWGKERKMYGYDDDHTDFSEDDYDDQEGNLLSMVNAWNGPNSPVPSIKVDVTFSPIGFGVFDFTMASMELSSDVILKKPGVWRTRWCTMKTSSSSTVPHSNHDEDPAIRIQALFVPSIVPEYPVETAKPTPKSSNAVPSTFRQVTVVPPVESIQNESGSKTSGISNNTQVPSQSNGALKRENEIAATKNQEGALVTRQNSEVVVKTVDKDFWDPQELAVAEDTSSVNEETASLTSKRTTASQRTAERAAAALRSPHLLRAQTYLAPSRCAVCSKILVGIRNGTGYRCETCSIDVCADCRLNVDVMVPCGSELASDIVEASFRNKMSPSGLLSYIAPDEAYEEQQQKMLEQEASKPKNTIIASKQMAAFDSPLQAAGAEPNAATGIGRGKFEIIRACIFQQGTSLLDDSGQEEENSGLRKGDYYVRVSMSDSDRSARTPTLQKTRGMPNFRSAEMRFSISHYGVEFRIDVVDADTDTIVGSTFLTTQGILQQQRDAYIANNGALLFQFLRGPIPWMETRKVKLNLRSGMKTGANADEYFTLAPKESGSSGLISGWVEISVGIEEFYSRLYGQNPIECSDRPAPELNMSNFSNYIARIKTIIDDVNHAIAQYQYMVSWKNPFWSATTLLTFMWVCIRFDTEYIGSLPIFFAIVFLMYCAYHRSYGGIQRRFIQKEVETMQKVEGNVARSKIYRPSGTMTISVSKGRNLINQELGIAGNTSCKVIWDPLRLADNETKESIAKADASADTPFEMGNTPTIYTSEPDWGGMEESAVAKRLNQLLPTADKDFFEGSSTTDEPGDIHELTFPILQPLKSKGSTKDQLELGSWESSHGAIVLQIKFQDFFNNLPGFDHILGEVSIPFGEIRMERELKAWFQILKVGTTSSSRLDDNEVDDGDLICGSRGINPPRVYVTLKWDPPKLQALDDPNDDEREMSNAIQEELVKSSTMLKESKVNLVDSSIGAVSKALGIGGTVQVVQNTLGSIIDSIEGLINILNFTDPYKSSMVFAGLVPVWIVTRLIPTRYIVLVAGMAQYGVTFVDKYGEDIGILPKKEAAKEPTEKKGKPNPILVKIKNALRSIPNNEDLRKTYFWESRKLGAEKARKYALAKRESRLAKLWKAKWHSSMKILVPDGKVFSLKPVFAVVQGHRFIWWGSVDEFDDGELPLGKLILSGHAGLGGPSPIEMRELDRDTPNAPFEHEAW